MSLMATRDPSEQSDSIVEFFSICIPQPITSAFLSQPGNGEYCLSCSSDRTVRLWNPHKGVGIKTYKGPGQEVLDADASVERNCIR